MTSRIGLRHIAKISRRAVAWYDAASAYFDLVGSVWFPEPWSYFDMESTGNLSVGANTNDAGNWGGAYFDRV